MTGFVKEYALAISQYKASIYAIWHFIIISKFRNKNIYFQLNLWKPKYIFVCTFRLRTCHTWHTLFQLVKREKILLISMALKMEPCWKRSLCESRDRICGPLKFGSVMTSHVSLVYRKGWIQILYLKMISILLPFHLEKWKWRSGCHQIQDNSIPGVLCKH